MIVLDTDGGRLLAGAGPPKPLQDDEEEEEIDFYFMKG